MRAKTEQRGRQAQELARSEAKRTAEEKLAARKAAQKPRSTRPRSAGSVGSTSSRGGGAARRSPHPNPRSFSGIKIDAPLFGNRRGDREDGGGGGAAEFDAADATGPNNLDLASVALHTSSEAQRLRVLAGHARVAAEAAADLEAETAAKLARCDAEASSAAAAAEAARARNTACRFDVYEHDKTGVMVPGIYRILTTHHEQGQQSAGWGLAAWHGLADTQRDGSSTWACVHSGDEWPIEWSVEPGLREGTWVLRTRAHAAGQQPAGWALGAWRADDVSAQRNEHSTWVAAAAAVAGGVAEGGGEVWPMEWTITPGKKPTTWRLHTTQHHEGQQPAAWGLAAWHAWGAERNAWSSRVAVREGGWGD